MDDKIRSKISPIALGFLFILCVGLGVWSSNERNNSVAIICGKINSEIVGTYNDTTFCRNFNEQAIWPATGAK